MEERVRGLPLDEILIKQAAGTLDGCTQQGSARPLNRNVRMFLLFLGYGDTSTPPYFYLMYGYNGIYLGPIDQGVAESRQILSGPPPTGPSSYWTIPLSRAPRCRPERQPHDLDSTFRAGSPRPSDAPWADRGTAA